MDIYRVSFIGHRLLPVERMRWIEDEIEKIARNLISKKEYVEFYVGRNGEFDILAASAVKRMQKSHGIDDNALTLVLPYRVKDEEYYEKYYSEVCSPLPPKTHYKSAIRKRNEWMMDLSDLLICFVKTESGGAYTAMRYAEKKGVEVINLAKRSAAREA